MPDLLIERSAKVATPPEAVTGVVPDSVPPPGFDPIAIAMLAELDDGVATGVGDLHRDRRLIAAAADGAASGCWTKTSFAAGADGDVEGGAGRAGEARRSQR